jgi:hypothetical protein
MIGTTYSVICPDIYETFKDGNDSLIDENFYSENNYKLLLICLREIVNIIK